jgi:hypothetical protein
MTCSPDGHEDRRGPDWSRSDRRRQKAASTDAVAIVSAWTWWSLTLEHAPKIYRAHVTTAEPPRSVDLTISALGAQVGVQADPSGITTPPPS